MNICADCKYYTPDFGWVGGCLHPKLKNAITDEPADARGERFDGQCGPDGIYFEVVKVVK